MRTKILTIIILAAINTIGVQAQKNLFEKLSDHKDIATVYISKSLLNMMPNMDIDAGGTDLKKLAKKLNNMEIYNSNNSKDAAKLIKNEIASISKSKTYEVLMKIKEKDNNITFFTLKEKDIIKDLIMFVEEPDDCTVIRISGNFTAEDIQGVMDSAKK